MSGVFTFLSDVSGTGIASGNFAEVNSGGLSDLVAELGSDLSGKTSSLDLQLVT